MSEIHIHRSFFENLTQPLLGFRSKYISKKNTESEKLMNEVTPKKKEVKDSLSRTQQGPCKDSKFTGAN